MSKRKKVIKKTTTTTVEEVIDSGNNKTHIVCILDSSGSMSKIINDAIGGFNEFLKKQKELEDEATITVALFDSSNNYQLLYDNVDLKKVESVTEKDWFPRGMTALYDAIGKTINSVTNSHLKLDKSEVPDKVLVAIVTDGRENDSKEYDKETIKKLIKEKENDNWTFVYIAADQNAFEEGTSIGVSRANTARYVNSGIGNAAMFSTLDFATTYYRGISIGDDSFTEQSNSIMSLATNGTGEIGEEMPTITTTTGVENVKIKMNSKNKTDSK